MQRALFARVLVQDADLILLDEPFNAVDAKTVGDLLALIERWHGEGRTVMVVRARSRAGARGIFPRRCCWRAGRSPGARRARRFGRQSAHARGSSTRPGATTRLGATPARYRRS